MDYQTKHVFYFFLCLQLKTPINTNTIHLIGFLRCKTRKRGSALAVLMPFPVSTAKSGY